MQTNHQKMTLAYMILGFFLIIGPVLMSWLYHRHFKKIELEEIYDDNAKQIGTALFMTGGVVIFVFGIISYFTGR